MPSRISDILSILASGEDGSQSVYDIFAKILTGLDARLAVMEGVSSSLSDLQTALAASGDAIVTAALDPVLAAIEDKADLGAILTASSVSEMSVETGSKTIVLAPASAWPMFAPAHMLTVTATDDPTVTMYGRKVSYDAATGTLVVNVLAVVGTGTYASWTIAPGSLAAMANAISIAAVGAEITGPSLQMALAQIATALAARQPLAGNLSALAALALAADKVIGTGSDGSPTQFGLSAYGKTLLSMASAGALRSDIGAAPLVNAALGGAPTAPTADVTADSTRIANITAVRQAIANLVNSSPATLDTLAELASALGNDANFATSMANALAGKQPLNATLTALSALAVQSSLTDAAANRLMLTGAFGLGGFATEVSSSGDLNALPDVTGFYHWGTPSPANAPSTFGMMLQVNRNSGTKFQLVVSSNGIWVRNTTAGTWLDWRRIHDNNGVAFSAPIPSESGVGLSDGNFNTIIVPGLYTISGTWANGPSGTATVTGILEVRARSVGSIYDQELYLGDGSVYRRWTSTPSAASWPNAWTRVDLERITHDNVTLADDSVYTKALSGAGIGWGVVAAQFSGRPSAIFSFRGITSAFILPIASSGGTLNTYTETVLTGTTGADGALNLGASGSTIYVENRLGASVPYLISLFRSVR